MLYDILIVGGGPAGLTAATYARRAGKSVLVIEKNAFGGQITWSPRVENFPGFVSVSGSELGDKLLEQAMEQGAEVELDEVTAVSVRPDGVKTVACDSGAVFEGRTLIVAVGAKPRMLGLEREEALVGNGVCFCAVCDGAFYAGKDVAVNGGGNSALQDALLLSEKCRRVYLIHRRDGFRGEQKLVEALEKRPNVEFVLRASVAELLGGDALTGVVVEQDGLRRALRGDRTRAGQRRILRPDGPRPRGLRGLGRGLHDRDPRRLRRGRLPRQGRAPAHHRRGRRLRRRPRRLPVFGRLKKRRSAGP